MIGILIISHGNLGDSLIRCVNHVMGEKSEQLTYLSITVQDDPDVVVFKALDGESAIRRQRRRHAY